MLSIFATRINFVLLAALAPAAFFGCRTIAVPDAIELPNLNGQHQWQAIHYPSLECEFGNKWATLVSLAPCESEDCKGLSLSLAISWSYSDEENRDFVEPRIESLSAVLITSSGEKESASRIETHPSLLRRNTAGRLVCSFEFPYQYYDQNDEMNDAWIGLKLGKKDYLLYVPYGFTRYPSKGKLPIVRKGYPKASQKLWSVLKKEFNEAKVVAFDRVRYDLGKAKNGIHVYLDQGYGTAKLFLANTKGYKANGIPLDTPDTQIEIQEHSGNVLPGEKVAKQIEDKSRIDSFEFATSHSNVDERSWGIAKVTVGDKRFETIIPSSLFAYGHGDCEEVALWPYNR